MFHKVSGFVNAIQHLWCSEGWKSFKSKAEAVQLWGVVWTRLYCSTLQHSHHLVEPEVGIRRENGALTVESLLRGLGAEAVIDDHESTWGLCAHSAGHDFQRSMFCGIRSLPWISEIASEIIDPL